MWYERAIVVNSIAADEVRRMVDSALPYNDRAGRAITARAAAAQYDLAEAHAAYAREREATGQSQHKDAEQAAASPFAT